LGFIILPEKENSQVADKFQFPEQNENDTVFNVCQYIKRHTAPSTVKSAFPFIPKFCTIHVSDLTSNPGALPPRKLPPVSNGQEAVRLRIADLIVMLTQPSATVALIKHSIFLCVPKSLNCLGYKAGDNIVDIQIF
jgi:hypothetical protein